MISPFLPHFSSPPFLLSPSPELQDNVVFPGYRCEVFLEEGKDTVHQAAALAATQGAVCAVLGAGNFEAPTDVLTKLFIENKVAVYKPNPVNTASSSVTALVLAPLVERGFVAFVHGGAAEGSALINHELVDEVIITGGAATYDRIVWGEPATQGENKKKRTPVFTKRVDAELGGVGPVVIVPGEWSDGEIDHQAQQICAAKFLNSGHICASPQVSAWGRGGWNRERGVQLLEVGIKGV